MSPNESQQLPAVVAAACVSQHAARRWASGEIDDETLWRMAAPPSPGSGQALFLRRNRGRFAWRAIVRLIDTLKPSAVVFRSIHAAIDGRAARCGAVPSFEDKPGAGRFYVSAEQFEPERRRLCGLTRGELT